MNIITLFCEIDDFFLAYEKWVSTQCLPETTPLETRGRPRRLHPSEVTTILIAFQQSNYRTFKHFYLKHVCVYWRAEFPHLVSYSRFVQLQKEVLTVLTFIFQHTSALVAGSLSWIPHVCASAITGGFHRIASSCQKRDARKHLWGGSMVLNFIWLSTSKAKS